jgi:hypothetical protein
VIVDFKGVDGKQIQSVNTNDGQCRSECEAVSEYECENIDMKEKMRVKSRTGTNFSVNSNRSSPS